MTQRWKRRPEGSNWGDFGADDQLGRINLLTPGANKVRGPGNQAGPGLLHLACHSTIQAAVC